MNRRSLNACLTELFHQSVGSVLGSRETDAAGDFFIENDVGENSAFVRFAREQNMLVNTVNGNLFGTHINGDGVSEKGIGETGNGTGHGGAKEQVLAFLGQEFEHLFDVANKAHVQHSVGFIENEEFNVECRCVLVLSDPRAVLVWQ